MTPPGRAVQAASSEPVGFQPGLRVGDPVARWWLRQVELRLRRELSWLWRRAGVGEGGDPGSASLDGDPHPGAELAAALEGPRFDRERRHFFETDLTAAWLTRQLTDLEEPTPMPRIPGTPRGFGHVSEALGLSPVERFVLALALLPGVDGAAGPVVAACSRDARRTRPTLLLAQRLWDDPVAVPLAASPGATLVRRGLLTAGDWDEPLGVPPAFAHALLLPDGPLPELRPADPGDPPGDGPTLRDVALLTARLRAHAGDPVVVPVELPGSASLEAAGAAVAALAGRPALVPVRGCGLPVASLRTLAWLRDAVLVLPEGADPGAPAPPSEGITRAGGGGIHPPDPLPGAVVLRHDEGVAGAGALPGIHLPTVRTARLDAEARLDRWRLGLGPLMSSPEVAAAVREQALRLPHARPVIDEHCRVLRALGRALRPDDVRAVVARRGGSAGLAHGVEPRFTFDELVLPDDAARQLRELVAGAGVLATVHHRWGTGRAWREGGLTALFAGPSGTGKTMAAEVVAHELGRPLTRIDLSQVVDKYIGETEKNLRRVFDAAEGSDAVLFFDEADALFGKRTEVKDAHDRYANLEVSYLLERMERFRGVAILATNRRRDLDEAFLRRLRWVVEFPLPDAALRRRLWRGALPAPVDAGEVELDALAERFTLTGGQIRSAVFHACLDAASRQPADAPPRLTMAAVVRAVRSELEKAGRAVSRDRFGSWAVHLDTPAPTSPDGAAPPSPPGPAPGAAAGPDVGGPAARSAS